MNTTYAHPGYYAIYMDFDLSSDEGPGKTIFFTAKRIVHFNGKEPFVLVRGEVESAYNDLYMGTKYFPHSTSEEFSIRKEKTSTASEKQYWEELNQWNDTLYENEHVQK